MPISLLYTKGLKNPPVAACSGRGPPAHQIDEPFFCPESCLPAVYFVWFIRKGPKNKQCPDLRNFYMPPWVKEDRFIRYYYTCWNARERGPPGR